MGVLRTFLKSAPQDKFLIICLPALLNCLSCLSSVRCGTNFNDLQEIEVAKLSEPSGWVKIPLKDLNDRLVRTFMVQVIKVMIQIQNKPSGLTILRKLVKFQPGEALIPFLNY